jgi:DNA-binding FadR family transcriptional regulator
VQKIAKGALPDGTSLYVAALADRLSVSRTPVKRALDLLARDGIVSRDDLRGYIVGTDASPETTRPNLLLLDLNLPGKETSALVAPSWEIILATVEATLMDTIALGIYQISGLGMCDHFAVSRTVTCEVLARLHDRGTIAKDRASHWIAGPLSARMLDDLHDIRRIMEPAALESTAPLLDAQAIEQMRARADAARATGWAFHHHFHPGRGLPGLAFRPVHLGRDHGRDT